MRDQFQKPRISNITSGLLKTPGLLRNLMLMATGGTVLFAVVLGIGVLRSGSRFFEGLGGMFSLSQSQAEADVRNVVVKQVRGASELTTSVFTMESVVPTRQEQKLGNYTIGATTLLYIAYGEVRAGVDLKDLSPADVQVKDNTIQLRLPPPRILDSKIDVNKSSVYDYNRGFLGLGPDVAPQLQTLAQRETLKKIQTAACDQGILKQANDRAQLVVEKLLSTAGHKTVVVKTQAPVSGSCK